MSRYMQKVASGHWVVSCRVCGGKRRGGRGHVDTARQAHQWWDEHLETPEHVRNADPNHFSGRDAQAHLLREIFGDP